VQAFAPGGDNGVLEVLLTNARTAFIADRDCLVLVTKTVTDMTIHVVSSLALTIVVMQNGHEILETHADVPGLLRPTSLSTRGLSLAAACRRCGRLPVYRRSHL